jgi:bifunctional DNA-binding transcriptional regulator/antitoxin component of YhaV-PrlF toxin-antitoxin module
MLVLMRTVTISKGGQVSIPAKVRHRWGTDKVALDDQGTALVIRPIPEDPIGAAIGSLSRRSPKSDELRALVRGEEAAKDDIRKGRR